MVRPGPLPPFQLQRSPTRNLVHDENGEESHVDRHRSLVPFDAERTYMEDTLAWSRLQESFDRGLDGPIGMEHLAPERTPPSDIDPNFDFSLLLRRNNPRPETPPQPGTPPHEQRRRRYLDPTPSEPMFRNRLSSEGEEEVHVDWIIRNAQANSRTPLIPENKRSVSEPEITSSPATIMQKYYGTIESRLGYGVILGGRRHFGYYPKEKFWPFPINNALRAMEDRLIYSLGVQPGGTVVLDAGCGEGYVAMHLARYGQMRVHCIDIVDRHVSKTQRNIMKRKLEESVTVEKMDYHNLSSVGDKTFDGVYAMETICHATNPEGVFTEFLRLLKPNGTLILHDFALSDTVTCPESFKASAEMFTSLNHVTLLQESTLKNMVQQQGFKDVVIEDISVHVMPLLRLLLAMAYVPYFFIRHCGLRRFFVNQTSAVILYKGMKMRYWKYVVVKGKKPDPIATTQPIPIPNRRQG